MIRLTLQDQQETADFEVIAEPLITRPLIAETDVQTIDNNISTYITGTTKRQLEVSLGFVDAEAYERLRGFRDRQYSLLKYPTVTITTDTPINLGPSEDVPDYKNRVVELKGKNLFDGVFELGNISTTTGENIDDTSMIRTTNSIKIVGGSTYTISVVNGGNVALRFYQSNGTFIGVGTTGASPNSFTAPDNAGLLRFIITSNTNLETQVQCEVGPNATDYEPFFDYELYKIEGIGTSYQDKIYKDGTTWKIRKEVGKKIVTGDESGIDIYSSMLRVPLSGWEKGDSAVIFSDYFIFGYANRTGYCYASTANRLAMGITGVTTVSAGTEWLKTHRPVFYGALATPTETEITNEGLIEQLNSLSNTAFEDWTKVQTSVEENNTNPILTITQGTLTGTGTTVKLEGTTEDLLDFVISGDLQQHNSANIFTGKMVVGGLSSTGGDLNRTDRFNSEDFIPVSSNTTYTFNCLPKSSGTLQAYCVAYNINKSGVGALPANAWQSRNFSFTTGSNVAYVRISCRYSDDRTIGTVGSTTDEALQIQLVQGSYALPNSDNQLPIGIVAGTIGFDISGPSGRKKYAFTGKMALSEERIVDLCGTHEQVAISIRESEQL